MNSAISYNTRQRGQILDCLIQNKERHLTADELIAVLNKEAPQVGKTTVYRYLDRLVAQGDVRRYFLEGGKSACYQYIDKESACSCHYHLKCVDCGQLFHMECEYLGEMDSHIKDQHDFQVDPSKTVFYGKCGECSRKTGGSVK